MYDNLIEVGPAIHIICITKHLISDMSDKKELESQDEPSSEIPQSLTNVELDHLSKQTNLNKQKIDIFLKATGNAPIMKIKKWAVPPERTIGKIVEFMRKYLHLDSKESLFLYINQAFAPSPDQTVQNLYECYGTDGKLVLHYCKSPAWG